MKKLWAGRFRARTSKTAESFSESISFDNRLWQYDIQGSIAHANMLGRQGVISRKDAAKIVRGLKEIARDIASGTFTFRQELEDIHMNIESALIEKIGDVGRKLHTARSRNDQVALDLRLYLKSETEEIITLIVNFQRQLIASAKRNISIYMPGYTHLQRAQPVLLSHHLLAYVEMLQRDAERMKRVYASADHMPLGSCALAGTTLPIDREYVARVLGFHSVSQNSIDAVSDRDFAIEFLCASAILMMHLSRLAEELILWSTEEFKFIELPEAYTTGSSIMPQKKNPDIAELTRAKTGRVYGNLISLLTVMKGLPLSYNRDLQEDKVPVFDSVDTVKACLTVLHDMFPGITFHAGRMQATARDAYSSATDVAEYLVKKGVPFRRAHEITGKIVLFCISKGKNLDELALEDLRAFSPHFSPDIFACLKPEDSIGKRNSPGGTSPDQVKKQIRRLEKIVNGRQ